MKMGRKILLVEDDRALARILLDNLRFEGYSVQWAQDGQSAISVARASTLDLIILDVNLPDTTGFDLFGPLRKGSDIPTIILTARNQHFDKIRGLKLGADDYITKPFNVEELLARVHSVLRRTKRTIECFTLGELVIDFTNRTALRGDLDLHLTEQEFQLLRYLAEHADRVVPRDELLREVWGYPLIPNTRSVDHAIARLRKKIELDPHSPIVIHTAHGGGYCLMNVRAPGVVRRSECE
jgi:DNA-binding response OmpR family regulator